MDKDVFSIVQIKRPERLVVTHWFALPYIIPLVEWFPEGLYDYGGMSEAEILKKRDKRYLKMLDHLQEIKAFEPG